MTLHAMSRYSQLPTPRIPQRSLAHANIAVPHAAGGSLSPSNYMNAREADPQDLQRYNAVLVP
jgi:hypothetical protein